ncbi:MAG: T9SS type A sorting domain-containing protein [Ignavibacteria bacterium]|nr:T9SS type A sorting domain-containing protein [Ignavibacteria bacterium]MCU7514614.1 T9SS type A sorting domain-containing protein [Ignavibacteria bacterium]
MRIFIHVLYVIIPCVFIFGGNGGIKVKNSPVSFTQHDKMKGLSVLQASAGHELKVKWSKFNSTPALLSGKLTAAGYASSTPLPSDGIRFISENRDLFGLNEPDKELRAVSSFTDNLKMTHVKYEQRVNGIRIYYSDIIVHFNSDGSIESVNGTYVPTPIINTAAQISPDAAISIAAGKINYVPSSKKWELVVYQKNNVPVLAYEVNLPGKYYPMMTFFIDAQTGEVIRKDDGLRYDGPTKGKGTGLNGTVRNIETYLSGGQYYLIDATLPMFTPPVDSLKGVIETYDALNDTSGNGYDKAKFVTDPNGDDNFNDNDGLRAAVDAHAYSRIVYNFYRSHYNRNSFDNKGGSLLNIVHFKEQYNNAFWNGLFMSYGDGDGDRFSNLAGALDVIGHEITHGVIQHTANLAYEFQPGAINESIADVFGSLVDSTNWLMGEDIFTPGVSGDALRNISDPHNGKDMGQSGWQPANMSEFVELANDEEHDWGGVHINSGIPNKAFFNVTNGTGRWKAGQIWYRALTTYLTKNAQFSDLRQACLNAAKDLYGESSADYKAVADGFTAVGIDDATGEPTSTEMVYDDGDPSIGVYEPDAYWQLGVRFSPSGSDYTISQVQVYTNGDKNNGTGQFQLVIYKADPNTGLPGEEWLQPYTTTPKGTGWQQYNITGGSLSGDFFVAVLYNGAGQPLIGADPPSGNGRAYEYDNAQKSWYKMAAPNDYTLFMRATIKTATAVTEIDTKIPDKFSLEQNYPNPFNPTTTIRYALPTGTDVKVAVYDITGKHVAELVNNYQNAGTYNVTWNGMNELGEKVSSGIYFCHIKAGSFEKTMKMNLLK